MLICQSGEKLKGKTVILSLFGKKGGIVTRVTICLFQSIYGRVERYIRYILQKARKKFQSIYDRVESSLLIHNIADTTLFQSIYSRIERLDSLWHVSWFDLFANMGSRKRRRIKRRKSKTIVFDYRGSLRCTELRDWKWLKRIVCLLTKLSNLAN